MRPASTEWSRDLKPEMPAIAGDHLARRRQRAVLRFDGAQARLAFSAVDVENPNSRHRAGRDANIAVGHAPIAPDGFWVAGRRVEATRNGWLLSARETGKDEDVCAA